MTGVPVKENNSAKGIWNFSPVKTQMSTTEWALSISCKSMEREKD